MEHGRGFVNFFDETALPLPRHSSVYFSLFSPNASSQCFRLFPLFLLQTPAPHRLNFTPLLDVSDYSLLTSANF